MDPAREIEVLVRAKYPILYVVTWEERRVEEALRPVAEKLQRTLHTWSVTQGMKPPVTRETPHKSGTLPSELEVLAQVHEAGEFTVFLLRDFHPYMKDSRVIRLLRDLSARLRGRSQTLILVAPSLNLPTELEKDVTVVEFPLPGVEEIEKKLDEVLASVRDMPSVTAEVDPATRELLVKSAQGLTLDEIESAFARSLVVAKKLDVELIVEEKKQIVRKSGLLEFYPAVNRLDDVGGHGLLKQWLERRTSSFTDKAREFGIPAPKGILLLGVQGCGKSLVAKAIAATWNLPMLRLDVGRIFDGTLVGLSEKNMRRALAISESVSPCVLWIDELEKGFGGMSGAAGDSGTSSRILSTFLTWMQEKTKPVFLIATANNVNALPPELLRKGRFDEIFFIDLPELLEREEIVRIHLRKRKRDPAKFKVKAIAEATRGFSGAEIEQVVIGALHAAFDDERELKQADLMQEAKAQVPLSVMMQEEIDELRTWAELRARPSSERTGEL